MNRRSRFNRGSRMLLFLAALLTVAGLRAPEGTASSSVRTLGVVDFYAITPLGSFEGSFPERFAADDLSDLLTRAGGDRAAVIPRGVVRQAEASSRWRGERCVAIRTPRVSCARDRRRPACHRMDHPVGRRNRRIPRWRPADGRCVRGGAGIRRSPTSNRGGNSSIGLCAPLRHSHVPRRTGPSPCALANRSMAHHHSAENI